MGTTIRAGHTGRFEGLDSTVAGGGTMIAVHHKVGIPHKQRVNTECNYWQRSALIAASVSEST